MKSASLFALAAAAGLLGLGAANAADLGVVRYGQMPPALLEYGSGWYLRGDIGWVGYSGTAADLVVEDVGTASFSHARLNDSWVIGAGFGYKAGWFRADVTADYRAHSEFEGSVLGELLSGEATSWSTLLNGYFDLGSWYGVTPYVGAGIGGAYHDTTRWRDAAQTTVFANGNNWDLAWAVMAGVAVNVAPHTTLDVGYRYIDLGKPESGLDRVLVNSRVRLDNVTAQEVRVGLRYAID